MLSNVLADIICKTFDTVVGRGDWGKETASAFTMSFSIPINYDKEEGYRHVELMIFAPSRYVQVWFRETWNVISKDDMYWDEKDQEEYPKKGKDYVKGASEWTMLCDHDSCWRTDGVQRFFREYGSKIITLDSHDGWYQIVSARDFSNLKRYMER